MPLPAAHLTVGRPGACTLVVDQGRPRSRSLGVPVGGAADRAALALGNALVGNQPDAAGLEIALTGPTLSSDADLACVVYGAPFALSSDRQSLEIGKTFTLQAGEALSIGSTPERMRAYFCVRGGLQVPLVLGSLSSFAPLQADTVLDCVPGRILGRGIVPDELQPIPTEAPQVLHVLQGPQADWFRLDELVAPHRFEVTPASNRMGLRLHGRPLTFPNREMTSEPVCPGAIQVTRDGQCIILGVDGQTIGGYPKVAQVASVDLDLLGQLRPGENVVFVLIGLDEARRLYLEQQRLLASWVSRLRIAEGLLGTGEPPLS
jgi:biotin-dependent carboxylase-like uncharacterized protein